MKTLKRKLDFVKEALLYDIQTIQTLFDIHGGSSTDPQIGESPLALGLSKETAFLAKIAAARSKRTITSY